MKVNSLDDDHRGLTRRQLLGLATLTSAGLAAASVGVPEAKAAGATMLLKPGALREMHWHPNADEWQLYLSGRARVTIFGAHGRTKTETFGPGEVAFIKQGFGHCVQQIGDEPTKVLILLKSPVYEEINISTWLAANPASFITDNFSVGKELVDKLPTQSVGIAAAQAG